mmetsp:Transcript_83250/g.174223  ORF Transcript_83250/g.174223 Transcript_83250/m.174223 type:complete len:200 (-) Transcript_83250:1658-2257(-)
MLPPTNFRRRRASVIVLEGPTIMAPPGQPRPLLRQRLAVVAPRKTRLAAVLASSPGLASAAAAFSNRAPSMCRAKPRSLHREDTPCMYSDERTAPPLAPLVFSIATNFVGAQWLSFASDNSRLCMRASIGNSPFSFICTVRCATPKRTEGPAASQRWRWDSEPSTTSAPRGQVAATASRFPCVPDATRTASSAPIMSAT